MHDTLKYLSGFGSTVQSEALPGAVPAGQNSPHHPPYGLHAEQINGVPFTVPRFGNARTWMYRIRPSVNHGEFSPREGGQFGLTYLEGAAGPDLLGWCPRPMPDEATDFLDGLATVVGSGHPSDGPGFALHSYVATKDMVDVALYDADGDLMILPDTGRLRLQSELGWLEVGPGQLAVIPRGLVFSVALVDGPARGFVGETYGRHFHLPERGPIGSNGLADERHFEMPVAAWEDREVSDGFVIVAKMGGRLYEARRSHSPFDVVGWHGKYAPYRYDLARFNAMGTVTWDHPDPSIYTVMSAPLHEAGQNLADLVVFPNPRYEVAQHTFRPPFFHRNAATELNFIVKGPSNPSEVFTRGGLFMTPPFSAHGVAVETIERTLAQSEDEASQPKKMAGSSLWLQFESALPLRVSPWAMQTPYRRPNFRAFAQGVEPTFDPEHIDPWSIR